MDKGEINTEGHGVYEVSWDDGYGWWAWTPSGILTGWAETETQAHADALDAMPKTQLVPKGQG